MKTNPPTPEESSDVLTIGTGAPPLVSLADKEQHELAWKLLALLEGVAFNDAMYVLTSLAPDLLKEGHIVSLGNPQMMALRDREERNGIIAR